MESTNNNSHKIILGIESSCDDTSASILCDSKIYSNVIASQKIHEEFGGVVPEWASRKHQKNILPTVHLALKKANLKLQDINAIACTQGPGLMGSLLVGHTFVKGLSMALNIPFVNVDHIDAHVLVHFIDGDIPPLPFLCLLVSGGHTQIVLVQENYEMQILGKTIDDAAGEAFDKAGKMLGLPYPSGPIIDQLASQGNPGAFSFNIPNVGDLNFSFSGLKTSILYFLQKEVKKNAEFINSNKNDLCASIQYTIVSYLVSQLEKAIIETGVKNIGIAGGVAANSALRNELVELANKHKGGAFIPKFEYCTDNAAMIAFAGKIKFDQEKFGTLTDVCFTRK
ncbi:tRNA (adenosine(37)-N6)-threonylcarbamoyltransferase complex transferase subunit TsaD [Bacteroidia bacterium]|nr:tRNA (adenosine(37)-N6)-threonylcarbamoyltransferase complex transferase subunit TsaD [Bacteroidia bacterium]